MERNGCPLFLRDNDPRCVILSGAALAAKPKNPHSCRRRRRGALAPQGERILRLPSVAQDDSGGRYPAHHFSDAIIARLREGQDPPLLFTGLNFRIGRRCPAAM